MGVFEGPSLSSRRMKCVKWRNWGFSLFQSHAPSDLYHMTKNPEDAPNTPDVLELEFKNGLFATCFTCWGGNSFLKWCRCKYKLMKRRFLTHVERVSCTSTGKRLQMLTFFNAKFLYARVKNNMSILPPCSLLFMLVNVNGYSHGVSANVDPAALYHHLWPPRLNLGVLWSKAAMFGSGLRTHTDRKH